MGQQSCGDRGSASSGLVLTGSGKWGLGCVGGSAGLPSHGDCGRTLLTTEDTRGRRARLLATCAVPTFP